MTTLLLWSIGPLTPDRPVIGPQYRTIFFGQKFTLVKNGFGDMTILTMNFSNFFRKCFSLVMIFGKVSQDSLMDNYPMMSD